MLAFVARIALSTLIAYGVVRGVDAIEKAVKERRENADTETDE